MKFSDEWTEGLTTKQQNLIVEYVMNECRLELGKIGGYRRKNSAKKFLQSREGRIALRKYVDLQFDIDSDTVKLQATKIMLQRAFFNPSDIISVDGNFVKIKGKRIEDLRELGDLAYCIEGVKTKHVSTEKGTEVNEIEIKLCSREKAIEFLKEVFQFNKEAEEEEYPGEKPIFEMTDEERDDEINRLLGEQKLLTEGKDGDNK